MYIWEGRKVRLRPIVGADWEKFHQNDLDSESASLCDQLYFPRSPEGTRAWAESEEAKGPDGDQFRFAIETLEGELVGSLNTHGCNPRAGTFKYGLGLFREHWRKGYGSDALMIVLRYFFEELRYQKVTAHVYSFNHPSIAMHERLGFQLEGRLRRMVYTQGQWHDELLYGMTVEEYGSNARRLTITQ